MHPILIVLLAIVGAVLLYGLLSIVLTFHPSKTQEIPLTTRKFRLFVIKDGNVNCYLAKQENSAILFDTGISDKTMKALRQILPDLQQVTHIFLTHSDYDHAGNIKHFPDAAVFVGKGEERLIKKEIPRFGKSRYNAFDREDYQIIAEEKPIQVGDLSILPIFSPGHTAGHTSYLLEDEYIFTGDLMRALPWGKRVPFVRLINQDHRTQLNSIQKVEQIILQKNVKLIGMAHSGFFWNH